MGNVHEEHIVINGFTCQIFAAEYGLMVKAFFFKIIYAYMKSIYFFIKINSFNFVGIFFTDRKQYWWMLKLRCICIPLPNIKAKERKLLVSFNKWYTYRNLLVCFVVFVWITWSKFFKLNVKRGIFKELHGLYEKSLHAGGRTLV